MPSPRRRLVFSRQLKVPMTSVQAAILLAVGLQCRPFAEVHAELGLPAPQVAALLLLW